MRYKVQYQKNDEILSVDYEGCKDAGMAFARCLKDFHGVKLIDCMAYSGISGFEAHIIHVAPLVQRDPVRHVRPARAARRDEKDGTMPFYDEALNTPPSETPEGR